jgi:uncharacterized damage-inducible protein DinB
MREVERIKDQHARAFAGPAWHGPAVFEVLQGVSARRAAARPVAGAHSIWEVVLHIAAWEHVAARRLAGEPTSPTPAQDWPAVGGRSAAAWRRALRLLERRHREAARAIANLTEAALERRAAGESYSAYVLAHGAAQHGIYHAGQIALLKKGTLG